MPVHGRFPDATKYIRRRQHQWPDDIGRRRRNLHTFLLSRTGQFGFGTRPNETSFRSVSWPSPPFNKTTTLPPAYGTTIVSSPFRPPLQEKFTRSSFTCRTKGHAVSARGVPTERVFTLRRPFTRFYPRKPSQTSIGPVVSKNKNAPKVRTCRRRKIARVSKSTGEIITAAQLLSPESLAGLLPLPPPPVFSNLSTVDKSPIVGRASFKIKRRRR